MSSPDSDDRTIPLNPQMEPPPRSVQRRTPTARIVAPAPVEELWLRPVESPGRRGFAVIVLLGVLVLYAWMQSFYYGGGHTGVDQAGYLMTARLIAGDFNPDNPVAPTVRQGGASAYTDLHPAPAPIQVNPRYNWLRNRLSFVPESPFQFSSLMNVMTEPFGPANPDKPAEYRYFAKYPFGYPLFAAIGRTIAGHWDKAQEKVAPPAQKHDTSAPAAAPLAIEAASSLPAATAASSAPFEKPPSKIENPKSKITTFSRVGRGIDGMYLITPLCTILACFFAFFLFRQAVSSFMALVGVLFLATNPVVLVFANDADSHAPTLLCVCAGFWGLVSFLRTQKAWRGWLGAFALGYAATIRYSEFILILPVAFAAAVNLRFSWKRLRDSLSLLAAWAIPVAALAFICWISFGSPTKTAYTYCNEDTGFGWKYLTGHWTDRDMAANWQTLLDQFNRNGLFLIWPLALAGLFGMIGTTWRLGGLIAAWVLPTMGVYLLYYWAPALGDSISLFYLRFFVSIIPGLIFAAVWLLDRAMQLVHTSRGTALALATALPLVILLALAFYADGGPQVIDGGLGKMLSGIVHQTPGAISHLFHASRLGMIAGIFLLAIIPATWLFDRDLITNRIGVVLGAGVITAIACAMNLQNIHQTVDDAFTEQIMARENVDNLREILPRGTAFFGDTMMLDQLDCVGDYKLYDASALSLYTFNMANAQLAKRSSKEHVEEPYPMQDERWQFYKELLTSTDPVPPSGAAGASGTSNAPGVTSQAQAMQYEAAVIQKNMAEGNKVVYVEETDAGDQTRQSGQGLGGNMRSFRLPPGFEKRMLRKWTLSAMPGDSTWSPLTALGGPRQSPRTTTIPATTSANSQPAALPEPAREGPTFVVWEIVKK